MTQIIPRAFAIFLTMIAVAPLSSALAQTQRQLDWCANKDETFAPAQRIEGCSATIRQAGNSGENLSWAFYNRGIAYTKKGQFDRAIADFDQALRLDPDSTFALNNRGAAFARKGEYDRAIADFNEAIRLDTQSATAYNNRGTAFAKLGDYKRALEDFEQAVRLDPKDMSAQNNRRLAMQLKSTVAAAEPDTTARKTRSLAVQTSAPNAISVTPPNLTAPSPAAEIKDNTGPASRALALRTAPEAVRTITPPPSVTIPAPPEPAKDQGDTNLEQQPPTKNLKARLSGRGKTVAAPKATRMAVHKGKVRSKVAHASGRSHRAKPPLLVRLLRKPFVEIGKAFRVASRRKSY